MSAFSVLVCWSVMSAAVFGQLRPARQGLRDEDFKDVETVGEAVEIVQDRLTEDGKPEYAALLTEERFTKALRTAIESYEKITLPDAEKRFPGSKEYFEKEIKPVCARLLETGEWQEECSFFLFYTLTDGPGGEEVSFDGLGLRLRIKTPKAKFKALALPVIDLFFGRFGK